MPDPHDPYAVPPEGESAGPPPSTPESLDESDFVPGEEERNLALIAHLSGIAGVVGAALLGFVGPLAVYLLKGESSQFVASQAKEALNFQITLLVIAAVCVAVTVITCGALFFVVFIPMILQIVFPIIASLTVKDGQPYRYPFNLRLIQ